MYALVFKQARMSLFLYILSYPGLEGKYWETTNESLQWHVTRKRVNIFSTTHYLEFELSSYTMHARVSQQVPNLLAIFVFTDPQIWTFCRYKKPESLNLKQKWIGFNKNLGRIIAGYPTKDLPNRYLDKTKMQKRL